MKERYENLNGLRVIACLCIIAMHIMTNANYELGLLGEQIIVSWTHFVSLFLMLSGFSMFCGYYERFKNRTIDLNNFYSKRYKRILPFFLIMILLDIVIERSVSHLIEGIMEVTLVFGLLPNNQLDVIGVSWTIGVIFLFYMLFPFIVYLCWSKKRACFTFLGSVLISLFCSFYFFSDKFVIRGFDERHNFLYCAPWLIGGGIVYLYRDGLKSLVKRFRWIWLSLCICLTVTWYSVPELPGMPNLCMLKNLIC